MVEPSQNTLLPQKSAQKVSCLWNRESLKVLNGTKLTIHESGDPPDFLESIWSHSEPE